jgi:hypothetical protein
MMSRGHGRIQKAVLAELHKPLPEGRTWPDWVSVEALSASIRPSTFKTEEPTRAQVESVRRAVKRLAAEDLIDIGHWLEPTDDGRRYMLLCRRWFTEEEIAIQQAEFAEEKKRRDEKLLELTLQSRIDLRGLFDDLTS